jgi:hypothetical protein
VRTSLAERRKQVVGLLDTSNFRRTLAGICLITQPLLNLISVAISPRQSTDTSEQLAMIGAHPTRFFIANLLDLLWLWLLIPAVLGLLHLLRSGGALFGHIGCGFVLAGTVGAAAYRGVNLRQLQVVESTLKQGQVLTAFGQPSLGSVVVMLISAIGLFIGYALLAVGLWRTRAAPRGASVLIVAFLVVDIVGLAAGGNKGVLLVAHTLLLVGLSWIGVKILAMSDAQWRAEVETQVRS